MTLLGLFWFNVRARTLEGRLTWRTRLTDLWMSESWLRKHGTPRQP